MADFVIGTRGSGLALWQAHAVADALRAQDPAREVDVRVIKTTGDRILDVPLSKIGDKGLFTKEIETQLLAGEIDMCVHSMKDVPSALPEGCVLAAMLPRADARDALVCGPRLAQVGCLADVPEGARIGTGSLRRAAQLRARYPQLVPSEIRGNLDTRLAKAEGSHYEGAVLAVSGIVRMGWEDRIRSYIPVEDMIPAVGQGAVGIEARADDERILAALADISHAPTMACVDAERIILSRLEGGCQVPLGAYIRWEGPADQQTLVLDAFVSSLDGSEMARVHMERAGIISRSDPAELAEMTLEALCEQGACEIMDRVKASVGL